MTDRYHVDTLSWERVTPPADVSLGFVRLSDKLNEIARKHNALVLKTNSTDASSLTNLNASNLTSGTVPDARFPLSLPVLNAANLTSLNASALASGTVPAARVSGVYGNITGTGILAGLHMTSPVVDSGGLVITSGDLSFSTAITRILPGATSLSFRNNANSADNLIITDAGLATLRGALSMPGSTSGNFSRFLCGSGGFSIRDSSNSFNLMVFTVGTRTMSAQQIVANDASNVGALTIAVTDWYGVRIRNITLFGSGAISGTNYGLYIDSVTTGAGAKYALFTNTGQVSFGDTTDSSSSSTGGIITAGGVGIAKKLAVGTAFGCNGQAPQAAFASGGAAPAGGTGTAAGGWDTAAHRDDAITLLNNIRSALVANGIMS